MVVAGAGGGNKGSGTVQRCRVTRPLCVIGERLVGERGLKVGSVGVWLDWLGPWLVGDVGLR